MSLFVYFEYFVVLSLCAGGPFENSPTSRRWVDARNVPSPDRDGRSPDQDVCSQPLQPLLSGLMAFRQPSPTLKRRATIVCSSGTEKWRWREPTNPSNVSGIRPPNPLYCRRNCSPTHGRGDLAVRPPPAFGHFVAAGGVQSQDGFEHTLQGVLMQPKPLAGKQAAVSRGQF